MSEKSTRIDYKLVNLNSANALVKNNGTYFSDVLFKFSALVKPEPDLKLVELSIVDAQIPVSFYNLNYKMKLEFEHLLLIVLLILNLVQVLLVLKI